MKKIVLFTFILGLYFIHNQLTDSPQENEETINLVESIKESVEESDEKLPVDEVESDNHVVNTAKRAAKPVTIVKDSFFNIKSHEVEEFFHRDGIDQVSLIQLAEDTVERESACFTSRKCLSNLRGLEEYGDEFHNEKTKKIEKSLAVLSLANESNLTDYKISTSLFKELSSIENTKIRTIALELKLSHDEVGLKEIKEVIEEGQSWSGESLTALYESLIKSEFYKNKKIKKLVLSEFSKSLKTKDAHSILLMTEKTLIESSGSLSNADLKAAVGSICDNKKNLSQVGAWNLIKNKISIEKNLRALNSNIISGCGV